MEARTYFDQKPPFEGYTRYDNLSIQVGKRGADKKTIKAIERIEKGKDNYSENNDITYGALYGFIAPKDLPNKNGVSNHNIKLVAGDPYAGMITVDGIRVVNLKTKEENIYPRQIWVGDTLETNNEQRFKDMVLNYTDNYYKGRAKINKGGTKRILKGNELMNTAPELNTLYDVDDYLHYNPFVGALVHTKYKVPSSKGKRKFIQ